MRTFVLMLILAINMVVDCPAQTAASSFAREYLPIWQSAVMLTLELAQAMPDSLYGYAPTAENKSFAEQMIHIGHSNEWMYEYFILGKRKHLVVEPDDKELNKPEVIAYLRTMLEKGTENIRNFPENRLDEKVDFFGEGEVTAKWIFIFIQDHLVNHRAKANLYFRLNGLAPPEYKFLVKP